VTEQIWHEPETNDRNDNEGKWMKGLANRVREMNQTFSLEYNASVSPGKWQGVCSEWSAFSPVIQNLHVWRWRLFGERVN